MDGNGRWAQKRHLPRTVGHAKGAAGVRALVEQCASKGVKCLTLFAFSTENWKRPEEEVSGLMSLFMTYLQKEVDSMNANGVRLRVVGDKTRFAPSLQTLIAQAEAQTAGNTAITLHVCANYGGRWDILQAMRQCMEANPQLKPEQVTEELLQPHLSMAYAPEPDLFIRTGGEQRISNFLLWQLAYTELYFTDVLWPDFDEAELHKAFDWFGQRERRFGRTSAQLASQVLCDPV